MRLSTYLFVTALALYGSVTATGQVLTVEIVSKTSTQVVLSYSVPDSTPCRVQVSENSNFQPLVHDVDPALFSGADSDQRPGSIGGQGKRTFVVGKRIADTARDGLIYSRALQAHTIHFYKITCATAAATGTFTVANIPFGVTYLDLPPAIIPTINDKDPVYDTQTGAFVKVAAPNSNHHGHELAFLYWGGFSRMCGGQVTGPDSGYMCSFPASGGGPAVIYYYVPRTDEMRYLGSSFVTARDGADGWDGTVLAYGGGGPIVYQTIVDRKGRSRFLKGTYTGFYTAAQPASWIPMNWEEVDLGPSGPLGLLKELNPRINAPSCAPAGVDGKYLFVDCRSGSQDSYPYAIGVVDLELRKAIAARSMMTETVARYCGEHNFHFVAPGVPAMDLGFHGLNGDGSKGQGPYTVTLTLDVDASATTFHVSGEPQARADDLAMIAQEGDHFSLNGEYIQITKKISPTEWRVTRGWYLGPRSHNAGDKISAECGVVQKGGGWAMTYWRFLDDPLGQNLIVNSSWPTGGHDDSGPLLHLTEGYSFITGPILENLGKGPTRTLSIVPGFAGVHSPAYGTTTAMHPSYHQLNDPGWFTDSKPMLGSNILSGTHLKVSGQLYKYTFGGFYADNGLHRKILPTLAFSGGTQLTDVSGPRSFIADDGSMSGTYCVALIGGECRPGSVAGDVYGNIANLNRLFCGSGDGPNPDLRDFCAVDNPPQAQVVLQAGLEPNRVALAPGEPANVTGVGWTRAMSRGFGDVRLIGELAKPTPDGKWLFFNAGNKLLMLKMPPFEKQDELDRSTFLPFTVSVAPGPAGTTASIQFGYAEYGPADQYYCTSRKEVCVAVAQGINVAAPFKFRDTESYSGVPCTQSCEITIPLAPQHIAYYQVIYLGSDGHIAGYGAKGVATENMGVPVPSKAPSLPASICSVPLPVPTVIIPGVGGAVSRVLPQGGSCSWPLTSRAAWLGLSANLVTGGGTVSFTASANASSLPRTTTVSVGALVLQVIQFPYTPSSVFTDIPASDSLSNYVNLIKSYGITAGCTTVKYCPDAPTTRSQMAVFIIRSLLGTDQFNSASSPYFEDVPASDPFFRYVQKMKELGITLGCSTTPARYCGDSPVTRAQMALFLIRSKYGNSFPFTPTPYFTDVPVANGEFPYVQKLRDLGITSGCSAAQYCGGYSITRGQMATFLVRTFLSGL